MDYLKTGNFSGLFAVTFIIAATIQLTLAILSIGLAFGAPQFFQLNGSPATSPDQALLVLAIMIVVILLMNAALSAAGTAIWLLVRKLVFRAKQPPAASIPPA